MVWWLVCETVNREVRVQIPARAEIWLKVAAPPPPLIIGPVVAVHSQWKD